MSLRLSLGFDGLFLWEAKARLIFQNCGGMLLDYLRANPSEIPYPDYPLLLPFTESWFYGFLGTPASRLAQTCFATVLLFGNRTAGSAIVWVTTISREVLLFFVPVLLIRSTSGEADFPLAVFYLAANLFLLDYLRTGNERLLFIAGTLAALFSRRVARRKDPSPLPMIAGAARLVQKREYPKIPLVLAGPGVLWIGFWRLFARDLRVRRRIRTTFRRPTQRLQRTLIVIPVIAAEASTKEFFMWRTWSMLWLIPLRGLLTFRQSWVWMFLVVAPIVVYAGIYIFTGWEPFTKHIDASYSRILTDVRRWHCWALTPLLPLRPFSH